MKLRPLDDGVVVKQSDAKEKTAGGIVLPNAAQEKPMMGKIVEVGTGKLLDDGSRAKMSVKKGQVVVYGKYGGSDIEIDGTEYKILRESEILGIVEK